MFLTVILVRGIRESAEANNTMVILKIAAILAFIIAASHYINRDNWHPFAPMGWSGVLTGGSIIFFTYIGFDSVSTAAEEAKNPQRDLPIGIIATLIVCTLLYIGVAIVLTGVVHWQSLLDDAAPVANSLKRLVTSSGSNTIAMGGTWRSVRRHDGNDFIAAGVSARTGACLVFDVARRIAAQALRASSSPLPYSGNGNLDCGLCRRHSCRNSRHRNALGLVQHRHAVCLRAGLDRGDHSSLSRSRTPSWLPRSRRHCGACAERDLLRPADGGTADPDLAAILRVARSSDC